MQDEVLRVDVDQLHPAPWNRDIGDIGDVDELAQSIAEIGLIEPVVVRPNGDGKSYVIVAGERRWAATKLAGFEQIQVIVRALDDRQALEAQLVENLQRKDIAPLEEAEGYRRLLELGMKQVEVSQRIGRSQAHVSKRLALLDLPEMAQAALSRGKITLEDAGELRKLADAPPELFAAAIASVEDGDEAAWVVPGLLRQHETDTKRAASADQLARAGVPVVEVGWSTKARPLAKNDYHGLGINHAKHRREPCHAAGIGHDGKIIYACSDPDRHGSKGESAIKVDASLLRSVGSSGPSKQQRVEQKELKAAREARFEFGKRLLKKPFRGDAGLAVMVEAMIDRFTADSKQIACRLLELDPPKTSYGYEDHRRALHERAEKDPQRVGLALAFAAGQEKMPPSNTWGWKEPSTRAYREFLRRYGWEPSKAELKRIGKYDETGDDGEDE